MISTDESIACLCDLIALRSENPGGNERAVADYAAARLRRLGLSVELVAKQPDRPNVVARAYGGPGGRRLILQAHLDTKPAFDPHADERWTTDPFTPTVLDGNLYGLGSADTKSGAAAQLLAIADFVAAARDWRGEIVWIGGADEENGSLLGAAHLAERGLLAADAAVIAEPTSLVIATAQLGNCWAEVTVRGRFGHAGVPWTGRDAIEAAMAFSQAVRARLAGRSVDSRFPGHPRLNVGRIEGGYHCGTVPNICRMVLDIRVRPGEERSDYFALLRQCADVVAAERGVVIDIGPYNYGGCHPNEVAADDSWVRALAAASDRPDPLGGFFGGSDAFFFTRAGTPSVVFGPGSLEQAHRCDESVPVDEVPRARQILGAALRAYFAA